jgi:hypothetical protein
MKLFIVPKGTKVALGNGDGKLIYVKTTKEMEWSYFVSDPIYYQNNKNNPDRRKELDSDPTIKEKGDKVAKYPLDEDESKYKFLYVNYSSVKVLC